MSSVFLCHSSVDKPFVRRLARDLVIRGIRVWLDEAQLLVGDSLLSKISSAIEEMDYLVVVLTPHSVGSSWVQKELQIAVVDQLRTRKVKVLPIIAADCEIPLFLRDTSYVRMDTDANYSAGLENLVRRLLPDVPYNPLPDPTAVANQRFHWLRNSELRSQLLSSDPKLRKTALQNVRGSTLVIPVALELLADDSADIVSRAIDSLKDLPTSESAWIELAGEDQYIPFGDGVTDGKEIVHYDLLEIISPIYDYLRNNRIPRQTLYELLTSLNSSNQTVRAVAMFTLIQTHVEAVIPHLISLAITEQDDLIREIAMWGLSAFIGGPTDDPRIKNTLLLGVNDLTGNVRYQALKGIRHCEGDDLVKIVAGMLNDPSTKIVKLAIEILGEWKNDESFASLRTLLSDTSKKASYIDDLMCAHAVRAIASHHRSDIEGTLIALLKKRRYAQAFERNDRSAKYVVAEVLRALELHGSPDCLTIIQPLTSVAERVEVPASLEGQNYWPIEIGERAKVLVETLEAKLPSKKHDASKKKRAL